jgi:small subunit ribosomal protein S10
MQKQKIRIKLKSYEVSLLNESCEKIIDTASRTDSLTMGPIPSNANFDGRAEKGFL